MTKKVRFFIVISLLMISVSYVGISLILLNGRFFYTTSFNESSIESSKNNNLFLTDDLVVVSHGDSLLNYEEILDVWINKRYEVKYFGCLFYWTYTEPDWRYLNVDFKVQHYQYSNDWCVRSNGGYASCCDRIPCRKGDEISIDFFKCKSEYPLGGLSIKVD
jgi:hypothetical protein